MKNLELSKRFISAVNTMEQHIQDNQQTAGHWCERREGSLDRASWLRWRATAGVWAQGRKAGAKGDGRNVVTRLVQQRFQIPEHGVLELEHLTVLYSPQAVSLYPGPSGVMIQLPRPTVSWPGIRLPKERPLYDGEDPFTLSRPTPTCISKQLNLLPHLDSASHPRDPGMPQVACDGPLWGTGEAEHSAYLQT